jgi:dTDP-4-amino-4,6-dideoxygalactose transaminase
MSASAGPRTGTFSQAVGAWPVGPREIELVNEVLASGVIFNGDKTSQFEEMMAAAHDRRLSIFVNSGTTAIDVAVHALKRQRGWQDGDELLVPAITFVGTINPVIRAGLKPVFVDVDPHHYDIDAGQLERHLTPRTRGIIPVHLLGQPCEIDRVTEFAQAHGLAVLEDSCETMFVRRNGKLVASWGDIACFSTFTVHLVATGIGGFVTCDDEELAVISKQLANHGDQNYQLQLDVEGRPAWERRARGWGYDDVGYSFRATDMEAALGIAQMERYPEIVSIYQRNAAHLTENLSDLGQDKLQLPSIREGSEHAFFRYGVVVKDPTVDRDALMDYLADHGVPTWYNFPLLNQPIYRRLFGDLEDRYPVAAELNRSAFNLGCHLGMTAEDMDRTSELLHDYFAGRS